jgi:phage terminase large subunit-like protein
MTIEERDSWVANCSEEEKRILRRYPEVFLLDQQLAPDGLWFYHWLCAARGVGKTLAALIWLWGKVRDGAEEVAIVAPTHTVLTKEILPVFFKIFPKPTAQNLNAGLIEINKSCIVKLYSTENEIRGANCEFAICEEMTQWNDRNEDKIQESWDLLNYAVRNKRAYPHPQIFNATTPRNYLFLKEWETKGLMGDKEWSFVRMTIDDAKFLSEPKRLQMIKEAGTSLRAKQELYAEIVDEAPGALFQRAWINDHRITDPNHSQIHDNKLHLTHFWKLVNVSQDINIKRGVLAIDPAITTGDASDETGIALLLQDYKNEMYVMQDLSGKHTPATWAKIVTQAFWHYKKFVPNLLIVAETNQGGDLVVSNLLAADHNLKPYIKQIKVSKGKLVRAEPVAAKYERGKVHHVGFHDLLERQMCNYNGDPAQDSPDRLDCLVHACNELVIVPQFVKRDLGILKGF